MAAIKFLLQYDLIRHEDKMLSLKPSLVLLQKIDYLQSPIRGKRRNVSTNLQAS